MVYRPARIRAAEICRERSGGGSKEMARRSRNDKFLQHWGGRRGWVLRSVTDGSFMLRARAREREREVSNITRRQDHHSRSAAQPWTTISKYYSNGWRYITYASFYYRSNIRLRLQVKLIIFNRFIPWTQTKIFSFAAGTAARAFRFRFLRHNPCLLVFHCRGIY